MALGNVFISDTDGKIPSNVSSGNEKVTGLLFDISLQPTLFTAGYGKNNETKLKLNDVAYITNLKSAVKDFGIIERVKATEDEENNVNFLHGIPYYHISEFFRLSGNIDGSGKLYVMFADCSVSWDAIEIMQRASGGTINQLGVWTEQSLWKDNGNADKYSLNIVKSINDKAVAMASQNQPLSVILSANPSNTGANTIEGKKVDLNKIPSCICEASRTSVIIGQASSELISTMQKCNTNHSPVGFLGAVLGCLAKANVQESIAWVKQFNLFSDGFQEIEFGFGDTNQTDDEEFISLNRYESLSPVMLDDLDDKGYIFPIKYSGRENGIYISKDQTCSAGDYRTIARNRTINKSRRAVRAALLPYVNSPLLVNPSTGFLAPSKITSFKGIVGDVLSGMQKSQEVSGYAVTIDANQNVLVNDTLRISYFIVPVGVAVKIYVEEGLSLTAK
ncbi:DUF2586 family protein [Bacteroides salyersiae]|uniref:DUF2586 family protein n=1 Tax=Bacteroides salyersiae TaxID=291644 RepID=A0A7J4XIQ8_9BACE|nr:DUF2586 family protein [Bacteroides salyersiae]KAA3691903.1 hypothetical protein F3F90_11825 [Bacteroides salyersiae]KAA3696005.1 hypothetical protein F3F89_13940 [Bacteroides salyersiae]KAA3702866.1 hypothetical protein F3F83_22240 [Bacteroides salyersiae]KAA3710822.1 hypothetical protein F3G06_18060 [Bacteroides salyersiae]KAA3719717.1 hypothetical protein F3F67_20960 [Bacteroides salyersiae]